MLGKTIVVCNDLEVSSQIDTFRSICGDTSESGVVELPESVQWAGTWEITAISDVSPASYWIWHVSEVFDVTVLEFCVIEEVAVHIIWSSLRHDQCVSQSCRGFSLKSDEFVSSQDPISLPGSFSH